MPVIKAENNNINDMIHHVFYLWTGLSTTIILEGALSILKNPHFNQAHAKENNDYFGIIFFE